MKQIFMQTELSVAFLREGKRFVAYAPSLDLSTSGKSFAEAKKRFEEIAEIFFEEIMKKGTVAEVLGGLGWEKGGQRWMPPVVVAHESQSVRVPAIA